MTFSELKPKPSEKERLQLAEDGKEFFLKHGRPMTEDEMLGTLAAIRVLRKTKKFYHPSTVEEFRHTLLVARRLQRMRRRKYGENPVPDIFIGHFDDICVDQFGNLWRRTKVSDAELLVEVQDYLRRKSSRTARLGK